MSDHYDAIIIGSGQAGNPLAIELAKAGWKTAIIERAHIGGSCINYGCTPTKTMAASARVAYLGKRAADYGVHLGKEKVKLHEVIKRKEKIVESFRDSGLKGIKKPRGLDLIRGEARFTEVKPKKGRARKLSADKIFINTGGRPATPPVTGLKEIDFLDSTSIMELKTLPKHLLVLGGGYVALEFGQMFRRFGSRVTIMEQTSQLLAREDRDVANEVAKILKDDGIEVLLNTKATEAEQRRQTISLFVRSAKQRKTIKGTHLLVATGHRPNTENLNLGAAGVQADEKGYIKVGDRLETNVSGIYALGDVKGGPAFTHISYDDFRIIRTNLIESGDATTRGRLVPYVVYIDPQLGCVGMTERDARLQGRNIRVAKLPMSHVARAIEVGETRGFMKAIVDADTDQILGAAVLGIEGGELMSMFEIAMMAKLPYKVLKEGIFAHPTLAESLNNLFMAMDK